MAPSDKICPVCEKVFVYPNTFSKAMITTPKRINRFIQPKGTPSHRFMNIESICVYCSRRKPISYKLK